MPRAITLRVVELAIDNAANELKQAKALQALINAGQWSLEGSMGRAMMRAIEAGHCMLGNDPACDYWGSFIPSRSMVVPGTKGSPEYVEARTSKAWRNSIERVD